MDCSAAVHARSPDTVSADYLSDLPRAQAVAGALRTALPGQGLSHLPGTAWRARLTDVDQRRLSR